MPDVALDTVSPFATPEHTAFEHRLAGPLLRLCAWMVDVAIRVAGLAVLAVILLAFGAKAGIGFWLLCWFVADWLLGGLLEWRWQGLTPGKKLCGIRVVASDGLPAPAWSCFLRNIMRAADILPSAITALATMIASGRFQRLGDLAAGTLVVHDADAIPARIPAVDEAAVKRALETLPAEAAGLLDGQAMAAVTTYVGRRRAFSPGRRAELAGPLALAMSRRLGIKAPPDPDAFLCAVHARISSAGDERTTGVAAARAAAHLQKRRPAWARLEEWLNGARNPRGASADEPGPVAAAGLYRAACADLALARAYHLPERTVDYLHRLVGRAHHRFYRRLALPWARIRALAFEEVPARLRGDWCLRVALAAFFGTFLIGLAIGYAAPATATEYLGQDLVDDMREMYADASHGREADAAGAMSGFYIHNNVGIALACFASGIFLGVGSLVWLAGNGAFLGLVFGIMAGGEEPMRSHFLEFVSAHGPFELFGITLAGAAGLRLGLGLFRTRGLTRGASLRAAARDAAPVLAVAGVLVALAAPIEAFISPSSLPLWSKRAVMLLCAMALVAYIAVLGRRKPAEP